MIHESQHLLRNVIVWPTHQAGLSIWSFWQGVRSQSSPASQQSHSPTHHPPIAHSVGPTPRMYVFPSLIRGVKLIFTRGHISFTVAFKGTNVILGLYKCNCSLTRGKEFGAAAIDK